MWIIDLLQLTKEHLSFLNNQEQDVFLPLELSVETLDLSLPLNWGVWLIIWYFRIPYKSPPYLGDYNFKKRHLIYRRHQGGRGRRGGGQEVQQKLEAQWRYNWKHLFDTSPPTFSTNCSPGICLHLVMAPHSSTLAWKSPWTEEPGRLQSMGSLRVRHDWATSLSLFTFMHWRRKWQPTPVFLPGESPGTEEPGGLLSMGSNRVGHDWSDLAAAAAGRSLLSKLWIDKTRRRWWARARGMGVPRLFSILDAPVPSGFLPLPSWG